MDSFTENILERARERQRKLNGKSTTVEPLKDANNGGEKQMQTQTIDIVKSQSAGKLETTTNNAKKSLAARKEIVSDSAVSETLKENVNFETFKRTSSTRVSSSSTSLSQLTATGTPPQQKKVYKELNIKKDDMNMEIKFYGPEDCDVHVEIQEEDSVTASTSSSNNKNSGNGMRDQVKHKLQKLGKLYSGGEDAGLSSPITRTEGRFLAKDKEEEEKQQQDKQEMHDDNSSRPRKKGLGKLADLAQSINSWEDDLTRSSIREKGKSTVASSCKKPSWKPPAPQPPVSSSNSTKVASSPIKKNSPSGSGSSSSKVPSFKNKPAPKPPVSSSNVLNVQKSKDVDNAKQKQEEDDSKPTVPKQLKWDKSVLDTLDGNNDDGSRNRRRDGTIAEEVEVEEDGQQEQQGDDDEDKDEVINNGNNDGGGLKTSNVRNIFEKSSTVYDKSKKSSNVPVAAVKKAGRQSLSCKSVSVASKAALFEAASESKNNSPKKFNTKDPALLTVSERKALFEKNKGNALIPKAAFGMSAPVPAPPVGVAAASSSSSMTNKPSATIVAVEEKKKHHSSSNIVHTKIEVPFKKPVHDLTRNNADANANRNKNIVKDDDNGKDSVLSPAKAAIAQSGGIASKMAALLNKKSTISEKQIDDRIKEERKKEMDVLLNRFNRNVEEEQQVKEEDDESDDGEDATEATKMLLGSKSNNKKNVPIIVTASSSSSSSSKDDNKGKDKEFKSPEARDKPRKSLTKKGDSPQVQAVLEDVKRIRVSQPKDGKLYPCLSDIEATTETESEDVPSSSSNNSSLLLNQSQESSASSEAVGNTSFGREIMQAVCKNITPKKRKSLDYDDGNVEESSDDGGEDGLADLDDLLMEDDEEEEESYDGYEVGRKMGPTPPKQGKLLQSSSSSSSTNLVNSKKKVVNCAPQSSESFSYKKCFPPSSSSHIQSIKAEENDFKSPAKVFSPRKSENFNVQVVDGENVLPLKHTVSFYRKQQASKNTPTSSSGVKQVLRHQSLLEEDDGMTAEESCFSSNAEEAEAVQNKIRELQEEVNKQLTVISQSSQALNLCNSTFEFSGSTEQVEAEKLLLLATHRRQAALHEIQRLEVEGTLQPQGGKGEGSDLLPREQGSLTISNVKLPLKREYVRALSAAGGKGHHVVCLIKCNEQVVSTQLVSTVASSSKNPDLELTIPGYIRLENVCGDSAIIFEVYCLQAQQEILPHDVKYHINKKGFATPKKSGKHENRMIRPPKESPAGPHAVRTPSFALNGYVVFSVQAKNRSQWTLNKTPSMSPLEGTVEMKVACELVISVEHRGFLTMFEDVSGFGAWHRRWCLLKNSTLSYWKYPDEERKKAPIDSIDLNTCVNKQVGPVSREICARLHTLLLERERWAKPEDKDSLTTICKGDKTIIRHLLSADTKEERNEWCALINKTLMGLRTWNS